MSHLRFESGSNLALSHRSQPAATPATPAAAASPSVPVPAKQAVVPGAGASAASNVAAQGAGATCSNSCSYAVGKKEMVFDIRPFPLQHLLLEGPG